MENNRQTEKACKIVFNTGCKKELLISGCTIGDIKQSRENADKSIFVFKNDDIFKKEFERLNKEISEFKASHKDDSE